jgi:hypothetical protein
LNTLSLAKVEMSAAAVHFFLVMRNQIKLYHWQTYSYARHKATDDVVNSLDEHIDLYVEVYMGKYGRMKMTPKTGTIKVENFTDKKAVAFVKECITILNGSLVKDLDPRKDTDLFNIRDEMLGDLNQLLYLFTLK